RILAWSGGVGPVALGAVELLQVEDGHTLLMLYTLPELMEHVLGVFPPDLLVLRPQRRQAIEKKLEELGIPFRAGIAALPISELIGEVPRSAPPDERDPSL
ncbi:MAG TPA: hypothetical protein PLA94_21560, partial [Myxococcota bacterium]|nr:hypothetical protein [Myxococcota bacterium]